MPADNQPHAVLATDLVDSTKLVHQLGPTAGAAMWETHDRVARDLITAHGGTELDKSDGFILAFPTADAALDFAEAYHLALGKLSGELRVALSARVGVHLGTIDPDTRALTGKVMDAGHGGRTLLTTAAAEALTPGRPTTSYGMWRFKGLSEPLEIHEAAARARALAPTPSDKAWPAARGPMSRQREGLRRSLRLRPVQLLVGGAVLLAAAVGLWQWDANRDKIRCYTDMYPIRGELRGVGPLRCSVSLPHFEVVEQGPRTVEIQYVNERGVPTRMDKRPFQIEARRPAQFITVRLRQIYGDDGLVVEQQELDPAGEVLIYAKIKHEPDKITIRNTTPKGVPTIGAFPKVYAQVHHLDAEGRAVKKRWFGITGEDPQRDSSDQCFGWDLVYDEMGRVVDDICVGFDGTWAPDANGTVIRHFEYGDAAHPFTITRFRSMLADRTPMTSLYFGATCDFQYDTVGRPLEMRCTDEDGAMYASMHERCDIYRNVWSADGYRTTCLGADEQPRPARDGWTTLEARFDENGFTREFLAWDADEQPVATRQGWHRREQKLVESHIVRDGPFFDPQGKPILGKSHDPDENYNVRQRLRFGKQLIERDSHNRAVRVDFFDVRGDPMITSEGYASVVTDIGEDGWLKSQCFFGVDGEPVLSRHGMHCARNEPDAFGMSKSATWFDIDGNPTPLPGQGHARVEWTRDDDGRPKAEIYFAADGSPMVSRRTGSHSFEHIWHDDGWHAGFRYFGVDRQPTVGKNGWAVHHMERKDGRLVAEWGEGLDGKPALTHVGFARIEHEEDCCGRPLKRTFFGTNGEPVMAMVDGYRCWSQETPRYFRGRQTGLRCIGLDGQAMPVLKWGATQAEQTWDTLDRLVSIRWSAPEGMPLPVAEERREYDERAATVVTSWHDQSGALIAPPGQLHARERVQNDPFGHAQSRKWFTADGTPAPVGRIGGLFPELAFDDTPYVEVRSVYDTAGNLIEATYPPHGVTPGRSVTVALSTERYPVEVRVSGPPIGGVISGWDRTFSPTGVELGFAWLGPDGEAVAGPDGCARKAWKRDEMGRDLEVQLFAADDSPLPQCGPDRAVRIQLDSSDRPAEQCRLLSPPGAAACVRLSYDPRGFEDDVSWFTLDGRPVLSPAGWHRQKSSLDAGGAPLSVTTTDLAGELVVSARTGCAVQLFERDDRGLPLVERCVDPDGEPTTGALGCTHLVRTFDGAGQPITQDCRD